MARPTRVLLALAAPVVALSIPAFAWLVLPSVRVCVSIYCGPHFDPGGMNIFGEQLLTPAQTLLTAVAIFLGAWLLGRALFPSDFRWTPVGLALLTLACVIAITLPTYTTGPAPSVPCSTPGIGGPVMGRCQSGEPPRDDRTPTRGLVLGLGIACLAGGVLADRRRARAADRGADSTGLAGISGPSR